MANIGVGDYVRVMYPGRSFHRETGYVLCIDKDDDEHPYAIAFDNYKTDFEWCGELEVITKSKVRFIDNLAKGTKVKMLHTTYSEKANQVFTVESFNGKLEVGEMDQPYTLVDDDGDNVYAFFVVPLNGASRVQGTQSKSRLIGTQQIAVR